MPNRPPLPFRLAPRAAVALAATGLGLLALLAYANSLAGPFVFDDIPTIVENRSIRRLWPLTEVLLPDQAGGVTSSGRPLVNLSFALNHAIGGYAVGSYHALNVFIHAAAGLCLFGLVRRTLRAPALRERFGAVATGLGALVAGWWMLHPLQTESVTYIVQRAESLVGLCYLLTLYAFARSVETAAAASRRWRGLAIAACLAGMASKEVMISAPLVVLLYDGVLWSGSVGEAWRRRRGFYLGLGATWILLAWLVAGTASRGGTAGFATEISAWSYALTQCRAIVRYVALSLWPHPLVFDYGVDSEKSLLRVLPQAVVLAGALLGVVAALRRRSPAGVAGAMFFAVLAPSSSFVPIATQTIAEHRMYLPLAVLVALAALGGFALAGTRIVVALAAGVGALLVSTVARNHAYRSEAALWADTAAKLPTNARAHNNLGQALFRAGRIEEAVRRYEQALARQPKYPEPHYNLGVAFARLDRIEPALASYATALRLQPHYPEAHNNLGNALVRAGRPAEALRHYESALAQNPAFAEAHNNYGNLLQQLGRLADATRQFAEALRLKPDYPEARYNLGNARAAAGEMGEALAEYRRALQLRPDYAEAHVNAGNALLALERPAEAAVHYERAIALDPRLAEAHNNLGTVHLHSGRPAAAAAHFERALALRPDFADAQRNLAEARAQLRAAEQSKR